MSEQQKLQGLFRGIVLRHLSLGRLKVYVPGIYPPEYEIAPEMLPTAEQMTPLFGGNNLGNGCFSYPNIGSTVVCSFLNGDQNYPIVLGATQGSDFSKQRYAEVANELDESTGNSPACIHMVNVGKTKVKIYEGGMVEVTVSGPQKSRLTLDQSGNVFVECDDTFQVQAKNIKLLSRECTEIASGKHIIETSGEQTYSQSKDVHLAATSGHVIMTSPTNQAGKVF